MSLVEFGHCEGSNTPSLRSVASKTTPLGASQQATETYVQLQGQAVMALPLTSALPLMANEKLDVT